jgi:hypothetical protein
MPMNQLAVSYPGGMYQAAYPQQQQMVPPMYPQAQMPYGGYADPYRPYSDNRGFPLGHPCAIDEADIWGGIYTDCKTDFFGNPVYDQYPLGPFGPRYVPPHAMPYATQPGYPAPMPMMPPMQPQYGGAAPIPTVPYQALQTQQYPGYASAPQQPQQSQQLSSGEAGASGDWVAQEGDTLRSLLQDWGDRAGWRVVWNTDREFVLEAGAVFRGEFMDVSSALVRAFARATPAPQGTFYKGNRVLVINTQESENAD